MDRPQGTTLRLLTKLACVAGSMLALWWVFRRVDLMDLVTVVRRARVGWILAALGVFGLGFMFAAARWHLVLRLSQCQVHALATMRTVLAGHLFNTVLFGPTGGDIAKSALYARWYGFNTSSILATCVLDRFLGGLGFLIFAGVTPAFSFYSGHWSARLPVLITSPRVAIGAAIVALFLLVAVLLRGRFNAFAPLHRIYHDVLDNGRRLMRDPHLALRGLIFSVLSHLCISLVFVFSLRAVTETPFPLAAAFWVFPVISLITSAPLTVSGAGLREGAALFFLGMYGIPAADAVAAALLVLTTYVLWAVGSGVLLWREETARAKAGVAAKAASLSVVIPTLNEAEALPETVSRARALPEVKQIIVVDGGSSDSTIEVAQKLGCEILKSPPGRGGQLRLGATHAHGDIVVLLHADTWLESGCGAAILNCLRDRLVVGGGFWKVFRQKTLLMAGSRFRCGLRLWFFRRVMGDQVMFVRRHILERIGGVPGLPLMEEFELCRRLRAAGRLALAAATVHTSDRRFAKRGVLRTYARMWHVTARYYLGAPAHKLQEIYERD